MWSCCSIDSVSVCLLLYRSQIIWRINTVSTHRSALAFLPIHTGIIYGCLSCKPKWRFHSDKSRILSCNRCVWFLDSRLLKSAPLRRWPADSLDTVLAVRDSTEWRKLFSSKHMKEETYDLNKSTCISMYRLLVFAQLRLLIIVRRRMVNPCRAACVVTGFSNGGGFCVARRCGGFYLGLMLAWYR